MEGVLLEAGGQLSCLSWGDLSYCLWCLNMAPILHIEHQHHTYLCISITYQSYYSTASVGGCRESLIDYAPIGCHLFLHIGDSPLLYT